MLWLTIVVAVVMLTPGFLYLARIIRDPFHPLIFLGVVSYFLVPHRLLTIRQPTLDLIDVRLINTYLWVSFLSMVGIYAGWWWGGRRIKTLIEPPTPPQYDYNKFAICALLCMVLALPSHFAFKDLPEGAVSGYLRDWSKLWVVAAILAVQAIILAPSNRRLPLYLLLLVTIVPPVERFLNYGQRGDTFRIATLVLLAYMMFGKRPSKAFFLGGAFCLSIVLATLQNTRTIVKNGDAPNRLAAMTQVIPEYFKGTFDVADPGDEEIFGSAIVAVSQESGKHGYGLSFTVGLLGRFLPRELFPDKGDLTIFFGGYDAVEIKNATGLDIPGGAAPSGFANGYGEFAWGCFIPWIILAYFYRRLWDDATQFFDIRRLGMFIGYMMAMLYAVTQDILSAEVNIVFTLLPLAIIYRISRVPQAEPAHGLPMVEV